MCEHLENVCCKESHAFAETCFSEGALNIFVQNLIGLTCYFEKLCSLKIPVPLSSDTDYLLFYAV